MNHELFRPLNRKIDWDEAHRAIDYLLRQHSRDMARLRKIALEISGLYSGIFPVFQYVFLLP